jgi:hypothetical protein
MAETVAIRGRIRTGILREYLQAIWLFGGRTRVEEEEWTKQV